MVCEGRNYFWWPRSKEAGRSGRQSHLPFAVTAGNSTPHSDVILDLTLCDTRAIEIKMSIDPDVIASVLSAHKPTLEPRVDTAGKIITVHGRDVSSMSEGTMEISSKVLTDRARADEVKARCWLGNSMATYRLSTLCSAVMSSCAGRRRQSRARHSGGFYVTGRRRVLILRIGHTGSIIQQARSAATLKGRNERNATGILFLLRPNSRNIQSMTSDGPRRYSC